MGEDNKTIPPPPSGEIIMSKEIPAPPSGSIVMPFKKKDEEEPTTQGSQPQLTLSSESGGKDEQSGILNNIYSKYPGLKALGNVTLKADETFTREKTGEGDIEYFSPTQDSVRYGKYTAPHPKLGTHGILYNPKTNNEESILLDMLHGMKDVDATYAKHREAFKQQTLKDRAGDIKHYYEQDKAKGKASDGYNSWVDNYVDGLIRSEISEQQTGDYAVERKGNSAAMKAQALKLKNYLSSGEKDDAPKESEVNFNESFGISNDDAIWGTPTLAPIKKYLTKGTITIGRDVTYSEALNSEKETNIQDVVAVSQNEFFKREDEAVNLYEQAKRLSSFTQVQQLAELKKLYESTEDVSAKKKIEDEIRIRESQPIDETGFVGTVSGEMSGRGYDIAANLGVNGEPLTKEDYVKLNSEGIKTVGDAYEKVSGNERQINDIRSEGEALNKISEYYKAQALSKKENQWAYQYFQGLKHGIDAYSEYNTLNSMTPSERGEYVKRKLTKESIFGVAPETLGEKVQYGIGDMTPSLATTVAVTALTGGEGIAARLATGGIFGGDSYMKSYNDGITEYYADKLEKGENPDDDEAERFARTKAQVNGSAMATMGIFGGGGTNSGLAASKGWVDFGKKFMSDQLKNLGKSTIRGGGIGAGFHLTNKTVDKAYGIGDGGFVEGLDESAVVMAVTDFALHTIISAPREVKARIPKEDYVKLERLSAFASPSAVEAQIKAAKESGDMTQVEADGFMQRQAEIRNVIGKYQGISPEQMDIIYPKAQEKISLEKQLENADPSVAPHIEAKIEELGREIAEDIGAKLTLKETASLEKLQEKAKGEDGLTKSEKIEKEHYETRQKNYKMINSEGLSSAESRRLNMLEVKQESNEKLDKQEKEDLEYLRERRKKEETIKRQQEQKAAEKEESDEFEQGVSKLKSFEEERGRLTEVFDKDWDGLSESEIDKHQADRDANDKQRDTLFEEYATPDEKKKAAKLASKADSKFEDLKNKVGMGQYPYDRRIAEANYKESVMDRILDTYKFEIEKLKSEPKGGVQESQTEEKTEQPVEEKVKPTIDKNQKIVEDHNAKPLDNRGTSLDKDGNEMTEGFVVSPYKGREKVVEGSEITKEQIDEFESANKDLLGKDGHFVGTWFNEKDGKTYIDVMVNEKNLDAAKQIAEENEQLAIYDLKEKKEIPIGEESGEGFQFYNPIKKVRDLVAEYREKFGIKTPSGKRIKSVDKERGAKIADAFDEMESNPNDPKVKKAYKAFVDETIQQAKFILEKTGIKVEMSKTGDEYASPKEMLDDIRNNNHIYVFDSESGFGDTPITEQMRAEHPLLQDSGLKDANGVPMKANDVFRWVHDWISHGDRGADFSAIGEENAWDAHSRLYSPDARRAMTTETRGQNSWTNYGKHMRNPDGTFKPAEGENIKYTPQKVGLLPEEFSKTDAELSAAKKPKKETASEQKITNAKERLRIAKEKSAEVRKNKDKLGISDDPFEQASREAKADREVFDAYVEVAKEYIAKGVKDVKEFAKQVGEDVSDIMQRAWDEAGKPKEVKKTLVTKRAYEGEVRGEVKGELEKLGLTREIDDLDVAEIKAKKFVESVGDDMALEAIRNGDVTGATAAFVYAETIKSVDKKAMTETDPAKQAELNALHAELLNEWGTKQWQSGAFNSAMQRILLDRDLKFNVEKQIEEIKKINKGEIPAEVEKRLRDADAEIQELKKKIAEKEKEAKLAADNQVVADIKASIPRTKKTYTAKAKEVADQFRRLKTKPIVFKDANGKEIPIQKLSVVDWNSLVELGAKAIEKTGEIADGVKAIVDELKDHEWYVKLSQADKDAVQKQIEENLPQQGGLKIPNSTIRGLVEKGADNMNDLVAAVKKQIGDPELTDREIRDAITGYGKEVNKNKDEIETEIRQMKRIGTLTSKIEDVQAGNKPTRSQRDRDIANAQEKELRKKLKEEMKNLPIDEQEQLIKDKVSVKRRIDELERRIKEGDYAPKKKAARVLDGELIDLESRKIQLQGIYDKEKYKLELQNRRTHEKAKDLLWELWGTTRALRATAEFSFVGIQGLPQSIAHPLHAREAFKNAIKFMFSEAKTDKWLNDIKAQEWYPILKKSKLALTEPHAELSAREELFYSGWTNMIWDNLGKVIVSPTLFKGKESFDRAAGGWSKLNPFKAIERAAVGYLDTLRVLRFLDGMEILNEKGINFDDNPQAYKDMSDIINTLTGRASLGVFEGISQPLAKIFFSPRNWASALKTATPYAFYHFGKMRAGSDPFKPSVAQKMAISDLSKFLGLTTGIVAMVAAAVNNDDDPDTAVELDPRSSDFGKIKIGNRRIDPFGGKIQQVVFTTRMIMDSSKSTKTGDVNKLGVPYKTPTKEQLALQQAFNKLAPSAQVLHRYGSSIIDPSTGKRMVFTDGEMVEYEISEELSSQLYPIYWETLSDLYKDDPSALNGLFAFYAFFGGGVSVYGKEGDNKESSKPKRPQQPERPERPSRR